MRYKAVFIAGVAVGFVAGARAGRGAYDKMVGYGQQIAAHPKVQQATSTAQAKATELAKTAAAKAPDYAKNAAVKRGQDGAGAGRAGAEVRVERASRRRRARCRDAPAAPAAQRTTNAGCPGRRGRGRQPRLPGRGLAVQVNGIRSHYTPDTPLRYRAEYKSAPLTSAIAGQGPNPE